MGLRKFLETEIERRRHLGQHCQIVAIVQVGRAHLYYAGGANACLADEENGWFVPVPLGDPLSTEAKKLGRPGASRKIVRQHVHEFFNRQGERLGLATCRPPASAKGFEEDVLEGWPEEARLALHKRGKEALMQEADYARKRPAKGRQHPPKA